MNAVVNGGAPIEFITYEPVTYSTDELNQFAGTYFSEEINTFYHLKMEKEGLVVYINDQRIGVLKLVMKNLFRDATVGYFEFNQDANGRVTGFSVDAGRVKNLKFERR